MKTFSVNSLRRIIALLFIMIATLYGSVIIYKKIKQNKGENLSISNSNYLFGIDISHYQGQINWKKLETSEHPIEFIFIRATMGIDGVDNHFHQNWKNAKNHNYLRGAYHYYRPNENSTEQFKNYNSIVRLEQGDFIPILDIEKESSLGREQLKKGVMNWLKLAEKEYGVKPIVYTGLNFYQYILKDDIDDYPLWIAAYSGKHRLNGVGWTFHQFTEKVKVKGIQSTVDGNDFNGSLSDINLLRLP